MPNLTDKINLKRGDKRIALLNLTICYILKNIKKAYGINKFKISETTWDKAFKTTDVSYFVSDIQVYFEHIIKKYKALKYQEFICTSAKFKTELHSKLKLGIILKF